MGNTVKIAHSVDDFSQRVTVPRSEVLEIVRTAAERAENIFPNDVLLLNKEGLLAAVRENDTIDARSWKCQDSCGCPLTAAGRIERVSTGGRRTAPGILGVFFRNYDYLAGKLATKTRGRLYTSQPITFVLQD
jgi:hypothetical protein